MSRDFGEHIPAAPFVQIINTELDRISANDTLRLTERHLGVPMQQILADRLGVAERTVYRYKNSLDYASKPTTTYPRNQIEDLLEQLDIPFWQVYPDIAAADDTPVEPEAYCGKCREIVTPINDVCPWCDGEVTGEVPERRYCKREDAMRFPALGGKCWRCGGKLSRQIPRVQCACGCGTSIPRFNENSGLERRFYLGHGKGPWASTRTLPAGPFVEWLQRELRDLDPIQALSRRVGMPRDRLLGLLNGHLDVVEQAQVNRSLRFAATEGQGRGLPRRPGSATIDDLYPDRGGLLTCPRCKGRKSSHGVMCRACRKETGWVPNGQPGRPTSMTPELLMDARRLREGGLTWREVAERLQPRTRCGNVDSVRTGLVREFGRRGWLVRGGVERREAA